MKMSLNGLGFSLIVLEFLGLGIISDEHYPMTAERGMLNMVRLSGDPQSR
ncbi:MAG: hypothetical protein RJR35_05360 [Thermoanaerobacterales bacterium]|nr:hypothetical protein [Thermoanaerobacterales bacterium]